MATLSEDDAKRYVMMLARGYSRGNWTDSGIQFTHEASTAFHAIGLSELGHHLLDSRKSAEGNDLDLYFDSVWHALAAALFQEIRSRLMRGSYEMACNTLTRSFGGRPFYRGQARAWDITPSAWRNSENARLSRICIANFQEALNEHLTYFPDPLATSVGRKCFNHAAEGLAQHYELPTNLVDFSFDPLVAAAFACASTDAPAIQPRDTSDKRLSNCAVIYVIAAPALFTVAEPRFEFPPTYSERLYRQKGLFVNFGDYPGEEALAGMAGYSPSWSYLQQNCQRLFFPRTYPVISHADELRDNDLMRGDEFFKELASLVRAGAPAGPEKCKSKPPWHFDIKNPEQHGKHSAAFHSRIDSYIRIAALLKFEESGDAFDPIMIKLLHKHVGLEMDS